MKIKEITFGAMLLAVSFLFFSACGQTGSADNTSTQTEEAGPEYTSNYICPMHCKGSGSDKAGKCPTCGMDYVMNEKASGAGDGHEGHNHGSHDGHNHGSHDGHDHGNHDGHDHGSHEGHDHGSHEGHNH